MICSNRSKGGVSEWQTDYPMMAKRNCRLVMRISRGLLKALFNGLHISRDGEMMAKATSNPVISISLKSAKQTTFSVFHLPTGGDYRNQVDEKAPGA